MAAFELFRERQNIMRLKERVPKGHSIESLSEALTSAVRKNADGLGECAVLFSGGLDSGLVAFLLKGFVGKVKLYCAGLKESKALPRAKENAKLLGLELREIVIGKEEIPGLLQETREAIGSDDRLQLEIAVPAFAALRAVKADSIGTVFSGTGADELFCGYKEFSTVLEEKGYAGVQGLIWEKLEGMYERNLKRELALARHFGVELMAPFLEEGFALQAMAFPAEEKILSPEDELRKRPLRELGRTLGLPDAICSEKKKAIQFDSGISKELAKLFRCRAR